MEGPKGEKRATPRRALGCRYISFEQSMTCAERPPGPISTCGSPRNLTDVADIPLGGFKLASPTCFSQLASDELFACQGQRMPGAFWVAMLDLHSCHHSATVQATVKAALFSIFRYWVFSPRQIRPSLSMLLRPPNAEAIDTMFGQFHVKRLLRLTAYKNFGSIGLAYLCPPPFSCAPILPKG